MSQPLDSLLLHNIDSQSSMAKNSQIPLPSNESRGPMLLGIIWSETCLALVFVALRLYSRAAPPDGLGWDDYTILRPPYVRS